MGDICLESVAAGYASGCAGLLIGHPLDSLKVMLQSGGGGGMLPPSPPQSSPSPSPSPSTAPTQGRGQQHPATPGRIPPLHLQSPASTQRRYLITADMVASAARRSARRAAASPSGGGVVVVAQISRPGAPPAASSFALRSLYAGVSAPLVTVGTVQSANFALYDALRRRLHSRSGRGGDYRLDASLWDVSIASFLSGGAVSVVTGPLVSLKIRQQVTGWGLREALSNSLRSGGGGVRGLYGGYSVHFACDAVGRAVFFPCYEGLKSWMARRGSGGEVAPPQSTMSERVAAAAISGVVSCAVVHPFDTVRTRINGRAASAATCLLASPRAESVAEVAQEMWRQNGFRAFVRGYAVAAARGGPVAAVAMPVYDLMLDYLNKCAECN